MQLYGNTGFKPLKNRETPKPYSTSDSESDELDVPDESDEPDK